WRSAVAWSFLRIPSEVVPHHSKQASQRGHDFWPSQVMYYPGVIDIVFDPDNIYRLSHPAFSMTTPESSCSAFDGHRLIASGALAAVAEATRQACAGAGAPDARRHHPHPARPGPTEAWRDRTRDHFAATPLGLARPAAGR